MANPITWRNIATDLPDAGRLMYSAQRSAEGAFNAFDKALAQNQATQKANWAQGKENNTQAFLDQLAQYRTPEAFAAAQQSGALQEALAGYGAQIDGSVARNALDQRLGLLQQRNTATQQYQDAQQLRGERPIRDQIVEAQLAGDQATVSRLLDGNELMNEGAFRRDIFGLQREQSAENRAAAGERRAQANQAWNEEVRGRQRDDWQAQDFLDQAANEAVLTAEQNRKANAQGAQSIARQLGIPLNPTTGAPQLDGVSAAVKGQYLDGLKASGYTGEAGVTEVATNLADRLRRTGNYSEAEISQAMAGVVSSVDGLDALQGSDRAELDKQQVVLAERHTRKIESEKAAFDKQKAGNIWLQGMADPATRAADVIKGLEVDSLTFEGTNKTEVIDTVMQAMTQGVAVTGKDGKSVNVPVPAPLAKVVLEQVKDNWAGTADDFQTKLTEVIQANLPAYEASLGALEAHQAELDNLNTAYMRRLGSTTAQAKGEAGIDPSVRNLIKTLEREQAK